MHNSSDFKLSNSVSVSNNNEHEAIKEVADSLGVDELAGIILFISPDYDPEQLEIAIKKHFQCTVIGCTTAGEIAPHYLSGGITAIGFSAKVFALHSTFLPLDKGVEPSDIKNLIKTMSSPSHFNDKKIGENSIGFLLIDGLGMKEECAIAHIHDALPHVPILGGSAGDNLNFTETRIFADGKFHTNAAVFTFIETTLDFEIFKLQHFEPSDKELVVTESDPANRIVFELDGEPAAKYYASLLGLSVDELTPDVFSMHPLMLQIGNDWYVRSIQKVRDDGSLLFYCAIDNGLPLTIGRGMDIEINLEKAVNKLNEIFDNVEISIGCDCILRRLEILANKKENLIAGLLKRINLFGFSTYGEQFNSLHINQTLTGVIFGDKRL